jgi:hydrophobic/amphiphilic exporter-1 (mainly G- bacteria), HAE1 family
MKRSITEMAINRPVTVAMIVVTMLSLGVIAWHRMPIEFLPRLDFPTILVVIPDPGATPAQVENQIAIPAEGEFRTLSHLKRITTTSDSNACMVKLDFDWDTNMALAAAEVRDRMERLKLVLPSEVDRMMLRHFDMSQLPVMAFAAFRAGDDEELAHLVRTVVQPRLMRIDGVAEVTVHGKPEREVLVEFDQEALRTLQLSLYQVVGSLRNSSLNITVGELTDGETKYYVRALGEFRRPEEIANLVVGPNGLRLKNVAKVGYNTRETNEGFSIDGKGGAFVLIQKESEANTVAVCQAVSQELDALKTEPLFSSLETFMFLDQSKIILEALHKVAHAGQLGAFLAMVVLFLFLRRLRPTLAVVLAIPASLVAALVFMFFAGMSLNLITMVSMIVAVGMLVDNSIVAIENIDRYAKLGLSPKESARRGASEVGLAITAATLTTVVVFIPIVYMDTGEMNTYMRQFAVPVTVALGASLAVALTVIPLAVSRMKRREHLTDHRYLGFLMRSAVWVHGFTDRFDPIQHLINFYQRSLALSMGNRLGTLLILGAVLGITYAWPARHIDFQRQPSIDTREVDIQIALDQNFDKEMVRNTFSAIESIVNQQRNELGIRNIFSHYNTGGGTLRVYLLKEEDLSDGQEIEYSTEQVRDILRQRLPKRIPGAEIHFSVAEAAESQGARIALRMRGDDVDILREYAERFSVLLEQLPHVDEVDTSWEQAKQEVQVRVDEVLAEQVGVNPFIIAQTVDFALRGIRLPYLKQAGREIPVWAQFREEDRQTKANLENVAVLTQTGDLMPLNALVDFTKARSPQRITREDGKNVVTVSAETNPQKLGEVKQNLDRLVANFDLPRGYEIELGDQIMELMRNLRSFVVTLALAVTLIYIVMAALFESMLLPLSILTGVPLAAVGVIWALFLTGTAVDIVALIGAILMAGIVVNNGIVIIDHINQLRRSGMKRTDAILQAGRDRFRPVMMTALTTILGCVPLAFGTSGGGDAGFASIGRALIGGLTTGTLLTLYVVPLFYCLFDDFGAWAVDFVGNMAALGRRRPARRLSTQD